MRSIFQLLDFGRFVLIFNVGGVGWPEVEHWMWPAFTERWSTWREAALQLPPVYLDLAAASQRPMPLPPLLLYTLSELVNPRPGYWPASVRMTGILSHLNSQVCWIHRCVESLGLR